MIFEHRAQEVAKGYIDELDYESAIFLLQSLNNLEALKVQLKEEIAELESALAEEAGVSVN